MFKAKKINFYRIKNIGLLLSLVFFVLSIFVIAFQKLNLSIDFTGGAQVEFSLNAPVTDIESLKERFSGQFSSFILQLVDAETGRMLVRINHPEEYDSTEFLKFIQAQNENAEILSAGAIGASFGAELLSQAVIICVIAFLFIVVYLSFRFQLKFSLAAILALLHDVVITLGVLSLLQIEFNAAVLSAILTLVGYSINDTIVVFDRVRQAVNEHARFDFSVIMNIAVSNSVHRAIMTSLTTLAALLALLLFGGSELFGFAFALTFGVLIGTYSSIFVATPLLSLLNFQPKEMLKNPKPPSSE